MTRNMITMKRTTTVSPAEVLLNYAEAQAELGGLTDAEWNTTIGALRRRAGITGGTEKLPTTVDSYLQQVFYPNITNPV